jgi:antitoxin component YwqK of YwqJK toxin-antitoxin module
MKKTTISIIIGAMFVFTPLATNAATTQELQAQIQLLLTTVQQLQLQLAQTQGVVTTTQNIQPTVTKPNILNTSQTCPNLYRNLWVGLRGNDVSELQRFLQSTGDYTYGSITGYYGPATMRAVQRWQARNGIVSYGSPNTTGFGVVGPATRRAFNSVCAIPSVTPKRVIGGQNIQNDTVGNSMSLASIIDTNSKDGIDKTYFIDLYSDVNNTNMSIDAVVTTRYPDGQMKEEVTVLNGSLNGPIKLWYPNGQLKAEGAFLNNNINGTIRKWHENGQLEIEITYVNGKMSGLAREWYENGILKAEINYNSNGEYDGLQKLWYKDGKIGNEIYYKNGQRHGLFRYYDPSGYLSKEKTYINGNLITEKEFDANGNIISNSDSMTTSNYSIDQSSVIVEQMTNKFIISGTAPQGVQSVFVALVEPAVVGSEIKWQTIYERNLYRAHSGSSIVQVRNGKWKTEFAGIGSGNYFVYLYEGGVSQRFIGKYPLQISSATGYVLSGLNNRIRPIGLNQTLELEGIRATVKDVRYSNGKTGTPNVVLLVEAPGRAPTLYIKTIGSSIIIKKSYDTDIEFKVSNIVVPMKSVDLKVTKYVKG